MPGKIARLKSSIQHRTLAPFGGITRIRFKGSPGSTPDSQPLRLPRSLIRSESKARVQQVNNRCALIVGEQY